MAAGIRDRYKTPPYTPWHETQPNAHVTVLPYTMVGVHHTPWGVFPSSISRQPRGCQSRTTRLRKPSARRFHRRPFPAPALLSNQLWMEKFEHGKSGHGGRGVTFTAVWTRNRSLVFYRCYSTRSKQVKPPERCVPMKLLKHCIKALTGCYIDGQSGT